MEYLAHRCCMCPQINSDRPICPGIPETPHPEPSPCRFVKRYRDARGWTYFVRAGIGGDTFKAVYHQPDKISPHGWRSVPWRDSFDKAQADLNREAQKRGWQEV
jgi:hypothetical protein